MGDLNIQSPEKKTVTILRWAVIPEVGAAAPASECVGEPVSSKKNVHICHFHVSREVSGYGLNPCGNLLCNHRAGKMYFSSLT